MSSGSGQAFLVSARMFPDRRSVGDALVSCSLINGRFKDPDLATPKIGEIPGAKPGRRWCSEIAWT